MDGWYANANHHQKIAHINGRHQVRSNRWNPICSRGANHWLICIFILNRCRSPDEMAGKSFHEAFKNGIQMRCLDFYGRHPERDGPILVGILIGKHAGVHSFTSTLSIHRSCLKPKFTQFFRTINWHTDFHGYHITVQARMFRNFRIQTESERLHTCILQTCRPPWEFRDLGWSSVYGQWHAADMVISSCTWDHQFYSKLFYILHSIIPCQIFSIIHGMHTLLGCHKL